MSTIIPASELILNPDGSIYHLNLRPDDIANDIITVGDPDRVDVVAQRFDTVYLTKHKREFKSVTGRVGDKDITIISTGIGTDNIDIVFTELDALVNIDFTTRTIRSTHQSLNFYRLGTSGAIRADIPIDSFVISGGGIGLDGLLHFYEYDETSNEQLAQTTINTCLSQYLPSVKAYAVEASKALTQKFSSLGRVGTTVTATGFYGPQGRKLRTAPKHQTFLDELAKVELDMPITNLEMETAGIYAMSKLLGHQAISLNAILANRVTNEFSSNPEKTTEQLIDSFFELL